MEAFEETIRDGFIILIVGGLILFVINFL